jgi:hypothetical protein
MAIASKDDSQTLGREVLRRNVRHHLKTEPIRVRAPLRELQRAIVALLSPRSASRAQTGGSVRKVHLQE